MLNRISLQLVIKQTSFGCGELMNKGFYWDDTLHYTLWWSHKCKIHYGNFRSAWSWDRGRRSRTLQFDNEVKFWRFPHLLDMIILASCFLAATAGCWLRLVGNNGRLNLPRWWRFNSKWGCLEAENDSWGWDRNVSLWNDVMLPTK